MNDTENVNDTEQQPPPDGEGADFDSQRFRTVADMRRTADPRMIAGVCGGLARHLRIDPILVRIVFAVMVFVGGAGIIMYAAIWFLIPADDTNQSIAADWFRLDDNEERVRVAGLVLASVIAVLSVVGDSGWGWSGGAPWVLLPLALLVFVFVVQPRRRREARAFATEAALQNPTAESVDGNVRTTTYTLPPEPRSWALTGLTLSITAIAIAVARIIADSGDGTEWTTYVALALGIVGLGVLISTVIGDGGPLMIIGLLLALALGLGTLLPHPRIGVQDVTPATAATVSSSYEHGIGRLELDLTQVKDPEALLGRTISLTSGVGELRIVLPPDLNVSVTGRLSLGEAIIFDRTTDGTDLDIDAPADPGRALNLSIDQKVGEVEVVRS